MKSLSAGHSSLRCVGEFICTFPRRPSLTRDHPFSSGTLHTLTKQLKHTFWVLLSDGHILQSRLLGCGDLGCEGLSSQGC